MPILGLTLLQLQALIVIIFSATDFAAGAKSSLEFVNGVYTGQIDEAARMLAFSNVVSRLKRTATTSWKTAKDQFPWYTAQWPNFWETINGRFGNFGRLIKVNQGWIWNDYSYCTAFYIAKDILVTSASCIVEIGITDPTGVQMIYVHQENGAADKVSKKAFKADGRLIKEWWVPAKWYNRLGDVCDLSMVGYDFAFLRVDRPKRNPEDFYSLVAPTEQQLKDKAGVFMLGYPSDVPDFYGAIKNDATLHQAENADKAVAGINPPFSPETLARIKENVLIMVAKGGFEGDKKKGAMGSGAAGGPVFLTGPNGVPPDGTRLHVVGITSWVRMNRNPDKTRDFGKVIQDATLTPKIRREITEVQEMLRAGNVGDIRMVTALAVPKTAPKTDCEM